MNSSKEHIASLEGSLQNVEFLMEMLDNNLSGRITNLETTTEDLQSSIDSANDRITSVESSLETTAENLQNSIDASNDRIAVLENSMTSVQSTILSLQSSVLTLQGDIVPPGTIMAHGGINAPAGWLPCWGQGLLKIYYPELYAAIGDVHLHGRYVGSATFWLPDLRALYIKGGGDPEGSDTSIHALGNNLQSGPIGQYQKCTIQDHIHRYERPYNTNNVDGGSNRTVYDNVRRYFDTSSPRKVDGSLYASGELDETRPHTLVLMYIIKT